MCNFFNWVYYCTHKIPLNATVPSTFQFLPNSSYSIDYRVGSIENRLGRIEQY